MNIKTYLLLFAVTITTSLYGQVGVNTTAPKATMDINAKRTNADGTGAITDNSQTLGLLAPRVTRAELTANTATYGADQAGALIYVTDISGGDVTAPRTNVTAVGYYYYDAGANLWRAVGSGSASPVYYQNILGEAVTVNSGAYTALPGDFLIRTTNNALVNITLPEATSANKGKMYAITNNNSAASTVTVVSTSNIIGTPTMTINRSKFVISDGVNWVVMSYN